MGELDSIFCQIIKFFLKLTMYGEYSHSYTILLGKYMGTLCLES